MSNRILLTTEELIQEANQLDKAVSQNKSVIEKCDGIVKNLLPGWEGTAQTEFANSWNTKRSALVKVTEGMEDLGKKIRSFANNMASTEKRSTSSAQALASV